MDICQIVEQLKKEKDIINKEIEEREKRVNEIDTTLTTIESMLNTTTVLCPDCNGSGKVFHRSCSEDDGDYETCSRCKGTGRINILYDL